VDEREDERLRAARGDLGARRRGEGERSAQRPRIGHARIDAQRSADALRTEEALGALPVARAGKARIGAQLEVAGAAGQRGAAQQQRHAPHGPTCSTKLVHRASPVVESRKISSCVASKATPASSTCAATTSPSAPSPMLPLSPAPCPAPPVWFEAKTSVRAASTSMMGTVAPFEPFGRDRKSTRLNSSHA